MTQSGGERHCWPEADKAGIIRLKHTGPITPEVWETELRPILQGLEAEG